MTTYFFNISEALINVFGINTAEMGRLLQTLNPLSMLLDRRILNIYITELGI